MSPDDRRALFLPILLAAAAPAVSPASAPPRIGPYELVATLGEGGMGRVFLALRSDPIEQEVALKLMRDDLHEDGARHQFWREAQALALVEHEHVARLYDAGVTADGEPWIAMEYVRGEPLLEYCDRRRLPIDARLSLLAEVCDAVQHLHDAGVHHRDLKPDNVLVIERDGRPVTKLIDLGLASLRRDPVPVEQMLGGTVTHMAPEQFGGTDRPVDGRVDVHAIGVMLYQLLIGKLPFARVSAEDLDHLNLTGTPQTAHARARQEDVDLADAADRRSTSPRRLLQRLRGDLGRIAQRAVTTDPARRTPTPGSLAGELRDHLADRLRDGQRVKFGLTALVSAAVGAVGAALAGLL